MDGWIDEWTEERRECRKTYTQPKKFHAAYHPNAPCGLNARTSGGHVKLSKKLNPQHVAVAKLMPTSLIYSGNASAEYVNGTGPSPGEYTAIKVKIAAAMLPMRACDGVPSAFSGRKKDMPHQSRQRPMSGKVVRSRLRRPKVSIV